MEAIRSSCKKPARSRRRTLFACAWVFVIYSIAGLFNEEDYCLVACGRLENRAGLLFGPFSPIYGVGALCIFVAARMAEKRCLLVQFVVFAATGDAVEYLTSCVSGSVCQGVCQGTFTFVSGDVHFCVRGRSLLTYSVR